MTKISNKSRPFWIYPILTLTVLAVYWQVRSFEFTNYDDDEYVNKNNHIITGLTGENVKWVFTSQHVGNWHPLTGLSHILDSQLFDSKAGLHHLTSLLFHILNTLLLFYVLRQMTSATWKSAFVAALFALHPLHVESVAWISERKDVLSTFFAILTIAAYLRYTKKPGLNRYLPVLLFFILALMSKPMLVTLPFVLLLLDYWPLERLDGKNLFNRFLEKLPLFVFSAASSVVTFFTQRSAGALRGIGTIPLTSRVENAFVSYAAYIEKLFVPAHLAVFYPHPENKPQTWPAVVAAIILVGLTVWIIALTRRYKYLFVGWFWYLGTLVPVIGLVQVGDQAMADRYTYIPLTGLFIIVAWGADDLFAKWKYRKPVLLISSLVILVSVSVCTWYQASYWRTSITLFEHALNVTKDNYVAHYYLTAPLAEQGKLNQAIDQFKETLKIKPNEPVVHKNMAMALVRQGNFTEAIVHLNDAIRLDPNSAEAYGDLGYVLNCQGKFDQAAEQFKQALRLKSDFAIIHSNFAYTLTHLGKYDEAADHLQTLVKLEPNSAANYYYLASTLVSAGRIDEAVANFRKTLSLDPNRPESMRDLAWILATHKENKAYNPAEAIGLAEKACKSVKSQNAAMLDVLAVAYAAAGKFQQAVVTAQEALRLAESSKQGEIQSRLNLYKESKPYIELEHK